MSITLESEKIETLADLLSRLGGIPLDRIRFHPAPGTATEQDVIDLAERDEGLFELVDQTLVQNPPGFMEAVIAAKITSQLDRFIEEQDLGITIGAGGPMRLSTGSIRIPDVSVVLWERLPGRKIPTEPIPTLAPDLAVEVLSLSNTPGEMARKLREYFAAGCGCVWMVDPRMKTVRIYDSPTTSVLLSGDEAVTAGSVLPGFRVSVEEIVRRSGID
jgi:Uma2 family endonuclease